MSTPRPPWRDGVGCLENFPGSDYTDEEREFLIAIDRYKRTFHRPHPTWREVLFVLRGLGWRKALSAPVPTAPANPTQGREDQERR